MPLEGQYLGRYRLLRLLGSGGMGEETIPDQGQTERLVEKNLY